MISYEKSIMFPHNFLDHGENDGDIAGEIVHMDNFVVGQRAGESLDICRKGVEVPIDPMDATSTSPGDNGDAIQFEAVFCLGKEHQIAIVSKSALSST